MPRYDYRCDNCCHIEEVTHSVTEDWNDESCWTNEDLPLTETYDEFINLEGFCPGRMYRTFQATPAVFKGLGWSKLPEYKAPKGQSE